MLVKYVEYIKYVEHFKMANIGYVLNISVLKRRICVKYTSILKHSLYRKLVES